MIESIQNNHLKNKVKTLQSKLLSKEERVIGLETENAMLHLKIAKLLGILRSTRSDLMQKEEFYESTLKQLNHKLETICEDYSSFQKWVKFQLGSFSSSLKATISQYKNFFQKVVSHENKTEDLAKELQAKENQLVEALEKVEIERDRRKQLHNTLVELHGNIRVYCRVRPLLSNVDDTNEEKVVHCVDDETVAFNGMAGDKKRIFEFEHVFDDNVKQDQLFNHVSPLLTSALDGYNVCIMAYGQTGGGKTHTMLGDFQPSTNYQLVKGSSCGIVPRSAIELFRLMEERSRERESEFSLTLSVLEIYNNTIKDLLSEKMDAKHNVSVSLDGCQDIPTLTARPVKGSLELMNEILKAIRRRHETATNVHQHSSRSHLIIQVNIFESCKTEQQSSKIPVRTPSCRGGSTPSLSKKSGGSFRRTDGQDQATEGLDRSVIRTRLQLVDLAGSESVGLSGTTGDSFRETSCINKSLSALSDVLRALSEKQSHVPYRNSRLTQVLRDTIGGQAKLLTLLCVSPAKRYQTETGHSLAFGTRARLIQRGPVKKRKKQGQIPKPSVSRSNSTNKL